MNATLHKPGIAEVALRDQPGQRVVHRGGPIIFVHIASVVVVSRP